MKNDRKTYTKIGSFTQDENGNLEGKIHGLGLGVIPVMFERMETKDGKEYFRGIANPKTDPYEIGAAFPREGKNNAFYYSVSMDSLLFPTPVNAALFSDKNNRDIFNLVWNRPDSEQAPRAEATVNVNYPQIEHTKVPLLPAPTPTEKSGRRSTGSQPRPQ